MKLTNIRCAAAAMMLAVAGGAAAQGLNSAYFTDEYKFRHDMNPAFGNEQNYVSVPALGNINIGLHGNFGYKDIVLDNPMYLHGSDKRMTTFMNPYISAGTALDGFSKGNNRIVGDVGVTILSGGFKAFGGYNTVEINSKTSFGMSLPYELFEFAKNTGNKTYDIGDVNAHAMSYVELAFGHSRQINEKLRVGAKLKFLFGLGRADLKLENMKADLAQNDKWTVSGKATADVSIKGFKYESEMDEYNNPDNGEYEKVSDIDVDGFGLGGFGMAVDLGAVYQIDEDWRVSASVLDLGFISWSENAQAVNRSDRFEFDGFHDISVNDGAGVSFDDQADNYGDQITDFINLRDNGDKGPLNRLTVKVYIEEGEDLTLGVRTDGHWEATWKRASAPEGFNNCGWCKFDNMRLSCLALGEDVTGVEETVANGLQVVGQQFFTVDGIQTDGLKKGVNIVRTQYEDGTTVTKKVIVK